MITENEITFSQGVASGRNVMYQDVIYKDKTIGASGTYFEHNWYKQNKYWFQRIVPENTKSKYSFDWDYAEDEGYIYMMFRTLQDLLNYVNEVTPCS